MWESVRCAGHAGPRPSSWRRTGVWGRCKWEWDGAVLALGSSSQLEETHRTFELPLLDAAALDNIIRPKDCALTYPHLTVLPQWTRTLIRPTTMRNPQLPTLTLMLSPVRPSAVLL